MYNIKKNSYQIVKGLKNKVLKAKRDETWRVKIITTLNLCTTVIFSSLHHESKMYDANFKLTARTVLVNVGYKILKYKL